MSVRRASGSVAQMWQGTVGVRSHSTAVPLGVRSAAKPLRHNAETPDGMFERN